MRKTPIPMLAVAFTLLALLRGEHTMGQLRGPQTESVDIRAHAVGVNRLSPCRVVGDVVLWVSAPVEILDDMGVSLGVIEAGLAQFGGRAKLEGCIPDARVLDLSGRVTNFLIADNRSLRKGTFGRSQAAAAASLLAQDFYRLMEHDGKQLIPLVDGIQIGAAGSVTYRFQIVLIQDANSRSIDAVVHRDTLGTKFAPRLGEADRRLSGLLWSSIP